MQDPGSPNPYGGPNHNPYGNYNPYGAPPPNAKQQPFGGPVSQDDRSLAMLAHLLQIFTGFLGPLVLFLVKREQSKFVAYHALQALVWQLAYMAFMMVGGVGTFAITILTMHNSHDFPIFFIFFWLLAMGGAFLNLVLGIVYTINAYNGEWSSYPVIGDWVRRFL